MAQQISRKKFLVMESNLNFRDNFGSQSLGQNTILYSLFYVSLNWTFSVYYNGMSSNVYQYRKSVLDSALWTAASAVRGSLLTNHQNSIKKQNNMFTEQYVYWLLFYAIGHQLIIVLLYCMKFCTTEVYETSSSKLHETMGNCKKCTK